MTKYDAVKVPIINEANGQTLGTLLYFNGKDGALLVGDWIEFSDGFYEVTRRTWKGLASATLEITVRPVSKGWSVSVVN